MHRSNRRNFQKPKPRSDLKHPRHGAHPAHPPAENVRVEGIYQSKGQFGFVLSEDPKQPDVMISGPSTKLATGGDRVRARVTSPAKAERRSGEILEVLVHSRQTAVGTFQRMGNLPVLVPDDQGAFIHLSDLKSLVPHVGDIITAQITTWPTPHSAAKATLTEILGQRDAPGVDLQMLIHKYELPDAFPPDVTRESDAYGEDVPESAWKERTTFFNQRVFTIDGADAKDFDDAVSLERVGQGWRLGVHIADVSHYVKEGSALDEEAYRRGTSVYLSGTVIPMLPFPLSDNLCSLRPDRIRLTMSCVMDIDPQGEITDARIMSSAIRSARRFTYEEVEQILKGETPPNVTPEIFADVKEMGSLAAMIRRKRFARGSLDFDFPEPEVVAGVDGRPVNIQRRNRLESHRLIEDFMLLANESVATHMKNHPFLYRIHETPDPAKMEKLHQTLDLLGVRSPKHIDPKHPYVLAQVIKAAEGTSVQPIVHMTVLRSLKQAVYSAVNKGHYGLASTCYTHFTSPIRRYPDLIVHRLLREGITGQQHRDAYWKKLLPAIATHTSKRERNAVEAEREYLDLQKVRLMESRVGDTFAGVISSVTNFGIFVQLEEFFVEGLVHVTRLGNDFFVYDEGRMILTGRRSGLVFAMGQKVKVQLAAANVLKRQLDFELVKGPSGEAPTRRRPSKRS